MVYDMSRRAALAEGLKAARRETGLSASSASALLVAKGLRCSRGTLLAWERGTGKTSREPFASDLATIAALYGCSVDAFFSYGRSDPQDS